MHDRDPGSTSPANNRSPPTSRQHNLLEWIIEACSPPNNATTPAPNSSPNSSPTPKPTTRSSAAPTPGSHSTGTGDRWTAWIHDEFDARHHWHLGAGGTSVIHVFLLSAWVELDITFAPEPESDARRPT